MDSASSPNTGSRQKWRPQAQHWPTKIITLGLSHYLQRADAALPSTAAQQACAVPGEYLIVHFHDLPLSEGRAEVLTSDSPKRV
jgi:hypothetical protein